MQVQWTLTKQCENCGAVNVYNSALGTSFKLSQAYKERELYRQAVNWCNQFPEGAPGPAPDAIKKYIVGANTRHTSVMNLGVYSKLNVPTPEPKFYYVTCAVCKERIYVC